MSAPLSCSCALHEPLSWLTIERYQLGELEGARRSEVAAHLEQCPCCRGCLEQIAADARDLPPLPAAAPRPRRVWRSRPARLALFSAVAAAAAVVLVALLLPRVSPPPDRVPPRHLAGFKGGELALALVRERQGAIQHDPERFAPGDRFKVLVTAPPVDPPLHGRVVVFQAGGAFFPLQPVELSGGNREPLPGAFSLSGPGPALVCLAVGDRPEALRPARLSRPRPAALPADLELVCVPLRPAR